MSLAFVSGDRLTPNLAECRRSADAKSWRSPTSTSLHSARSAAHPSSASASSISANAPRPSTTDAAAALSGELLSLLALQPSKLTFDRAASGNDASTANARASAASAANGAAAAAAAARARAFRSAAAIARSSRGSTSSATVQSESSVGPLYFVIANFSLTRSHAQRIACFAELLLRLSLRHTSRSAHVHSSITRSIARLTAALPSSSSASIARSRRQDSRSCQQDVASCFGCTKARWCQPRGSESEVKEASTRWNEGGRDDQRRRRT